MAILRQERIPADLNYTDDVFLRELDAVSIRSLSGVRDADLLLTLVPDQDTFRNVLKAIKLWAKCEIFFLLVYVGVSDGVKDNFLLNVMSAVKSFVH